jgi:hypothetical protein
LLLLFPFSKLAQRFDLRRELIFLSIPPAFYFAVSIGSRMNLGVRHILPVYPFLILLAAAAAWNVARRSRVAAYAVTAIVLLHVASSLHAFPNYLTYSNELAGGPSKTYRILSDSNADWGQGLKQVQRYLVQNNVRECWFAYSVPQVDLGYYPIPCKRLPSGIGYRFGLSTPVQPAFVQGIVLVSTTEAKGQYWGPGKLNPYRSFSDKTPDDMIANSILVFRGSFYLPLAAAASHVGMAQQFLQQKRFNEALTEAQTAVQLAPDSAEMQAKSLPGVNASEHEAGELPGRSYKVATRTPKAQSG